MATLAESLVSSSSRKLPIRMRPDLVARRQRYQGRVYWVVKDPIGLQYFRFEEEEYAILTMLDGQSSLEEIGDRFEAEFPPQTIRVEELQQFIGMLHRSGLVVTDVTGQGVQLKKRGDERRRKQLLGNFTNVLAMRFRGIDPEGILNFLYPWVRWFFTTKALIVCLILSLSALLLVLVQFDEFQSRLPEFQHFFAAQNWLWLGVTLACTKILHEFGHGMSCKHFGGECHEMGVMFLVLTPCLYCNVSDSWMLPNRWHRAAIGAAGMYVEVVLASICTFIWWFSEPGPLHYLCLNIMFVSSVSTILFNANPLLRYDGYYILSDILEIPNLRQKASSILNRKLGKWCLGIDPPDDPFLPQRHQTLFALYTVASAIYRWVIVLSILYFLNKVFEPYGLKVVGQIIALAACYGLVVQPLWKLYKFFKVPGRLSKVKRLRFYATLAVAAGAVAAVMLIPLPSHVYCSLELHPRGAQSVYVDVEGTLDEAFARPGDRIEAGQPIVRLANLDIELRIAQLEEQIAVNRARLRGLEYAGFTDEVAARQIGQVRKALESAEKQLDEQKANQQKLLVVASRSGTVLPPVYVPEPPQSDERLARWSGFPLAPENLGATLDVSTMLCEIGDPTQFEARLVISQRDIELVEPGQRVEILLTQSSNYLYETHVELVSSENLRATPRRLSSLSGGGIPTQADPDGVPRPLEPHYEAIAPMPDDGPYGVLRVGLIGEAKITTRPRTLGERLWRYLSRTFNFEL